MKVKFLKDTFVYGKPVFKGEISILSEQTGQDLLKYGVAETHLFGSPGSLNQRVEKMLFNLPAPESLTQCSSTFLKNYEKDFKTVNVAYSAAIGDIVKPDAMEIVEGQLVNLWEKLKNEMIGR